MAARYLVALRELVRHGPEGPRGLVRCCVCSVPFVTAVCNDGRRDLRCPFGCREVHQRLESARRSTTYYRTPEGRAKKAAINARRPRQGGGLGRAPPAPQLPPTIITYIREIVRRLDGRLLARDEIVALVTCVLRQRRLAFSHGSGNPPPPGS